MARQTAAFILWRNPVPGLCFQMPSPSHGRLSNHPHLVFPVPRMEKEREMMMNQWIHVFICLSGNGSASVCLGELRHWERGGGWGCSIGTERAR